MGKPDPIDIAVGLRIRARRCAMGLSQQKLAEAIGVAFQQVQKYEKARNRVGSSRLQKIANALQVPPSFFFATVDDMPCQDTPSTQAADGVMRFLATPEGQELNRAFCRIAKPEIRTVLIQLLKAASRAGGAA